MIFKQLFIKPVLRVINYRNLKKHLSNKKNVDLFIYGNGFGDLNNNLYLIKDNISAENNESRIQPPPQQKKENDVKNQIKSIDLNEFFSKNNKNNKDYKINVLLKKLKELETNHNKNNNSNNSIIHIFTEDDYYKNKFDKNIISSEINENNNNIYYLKKDPKERITINNYDKYCCCGCGKYKMVKFNKIDKKLNQCNNCNLIIQTDINQLIVFSKFTQHLITSILNKNHLTIFYNTTPFRSILLEISNMFKEISKELLVYGVIIIILIYHW